MKTSELVLGISPEYDQLLIWLINASEEELSLFKKRYNLNQHGNLIDQKSIKYSYSKDPFENLWDVMNAFTEERNGLPKCDHGWKGRCCCHCASNYKLDTSVLNDEDILYYTCTVFHDMSIAEDTKSNRTFHLKKTEHGSCECHEYREEFINNKE